MGRLVEFDKEDGNMSRAAECRCGVSGGVMVIIWHHPEMDNDIQTRGMLKLLAWDISHLGM